VGSKNRKVAMMQPTFLPWQGYFELIHQSELFIILDDFQFSVQSYHQRNRLFVNKGQVDWYSVPVRKTVSFGAPLNRTRVNDAIPWRKKMWRRIEQNYSKTPYFTVISPSVESWLFSPADVLADINVAFIRLACKMMGFEKEFVLSSMFPSDAQRSARVAELLRMNGADSYYSARGSFTYMRDDGLFPLPDVEVSFQDFRPVPYLQAGSGDGFLPYLSVLDALFNIGPRETARLIKSGTEHWLKWDEMVELAAGEEKVHENET
jgi:hypothetical protein